MSERGQARAVDEAGLRLSRLSEAILRISKGLDLDVVLQEVVDSARTLTGARYGAIITLGDSGPPVEVIISGLEPEEESRVLAFPQGEALLQCLSEQSGPLRTPDFVAHADAAGFPGFRPLIGAFLGTPVRASDTLVAHISVAEKPDGAEFSAEDEETLKMFAAQAAMAITNARSYRDEQRARAELEALIDTSPVGVVVIDTHTRQAVQFNLEARRLFGDAAAEGRTVTRHLDRLRFCRMDGSEIPRDELPMERSIRAGETVLAEEMVIERPDGTTVSTLVNTAPIRSDDGEIVSVVVTVQDITPVEELQRLRCELLGMASHELRAPLTSIKGSAATMRDTASPLDPAEVKQFFRIIEEQADRMRDLMNSLLDMTRIEAGTLFVASAPTDVASLLDNAKNAFLSSGHDTSIKIDATANLPRVWADAPRIVQVLHILFSNAARHSRRWSVIAVAASVHDQHVAISVTHHATGPAPQSVSRPSTTVPQPTSGGDGRGGDGRGGGSGLGLAMCRGIVEAHGGRIWSDSDGEGRGSRITSRITFTIPAVDEASTRPAAVAPAPLRGERILAIDADPQVLGLIHNTLSEAGYTPLLAGDPDEVEELLETEMPHLVLLDSMLPRTDGFELMNRIQAVMEVPVIVLSGRGGDRYMARAFETGAADCVVKPFSPTELLARIAAALRRARSSRTEPYRLGDLTVDYLSHSATVAGRPAKLTPIEFKLLLELCSNDGRVLTYEQLRERVWEQGPSGDTQRVRALVKNLRRKLGDDAKNPAYILTVPGVGYRAAKTPSPAAP